MDRPWFYGGDLNEILWDFENEGGSQGSFSRPRYLQELIDRMELIDLGFSSPKFTWRVTRNNSLVQKQLDIGLVNGAWQERWPLSSVTYGTVRASDHSP